MLDDNERLVLEALVEAHNAFRALPRQHPQEVAEWVGALHRLQDLVLIRPTVRAEGWVRAGVVEGKRGRG